MNYIRAVLTFDIPKEKLSPSEQLEWEKQFKELAHEIKTTAPAGVTASLEVSEVAL